ncbi:hypothetical protein EDD15DRAFT_2387050 [Pisolithus albus]|nr:hypothetical protein EDD15DRAFT_2387050 [Pisolithus albus]
MRQNQWHRWLQDIIPALVEPYLQYLEASHNLRVVVGIQNHPSRCSACSTHSSNVTCVFFDRLEEIEINACPCRPAPVCLMQHGLFASSPVAPTLAVDLQVQEFLKKLFVCLTPNTTAWCEALESFLDGQGYKLHNAYHWYTVLTVYVEDHVAALVHSFASPSAEQVLGFQPSGYLQSCCPLCFGASDFQREKSAQDERVIGNLDCIVCLDACFTQKRNNNPRNTATHDPTNPTNTVFIPESEVKAMECFDCVEDGMKVPTSVLDGCRDSFHAADEKWKKGSTQFFADTGLMALLCRHDRVLWLVNMTSAGEKQHYALVLLKHLFDNLPATMTVGLLYDIGCQLECSCRKWKLLEDGILSRLKFGISCAGFGLSDGEGCERLWSSLKRLIPTLRVSGYHQRLFVLDNQIRHNHEKSYAALGQWLNKKWSLCKSKKSVALENLHALHVDMQTLQSEWAAQVESQTQPLPRQSKNKGSELLAHILALEKTDLVNDRVTDIIDYNLQLASVQGSLAKADQALKQKKSALGVSAQTDLHLLRNNKWLQTHTNAKALKIQIRERLCQCKLELERLEQSYQNSVNENHLHSHPAISKLVTTYNTLRGELLGMIRPSRAPPGAIPPTPIPSKGLFQLDVDSDIWQDVGLGEGLPDPPQWLADEDVRKGIRFMLEVDRCNEEERRLSREWTILQEWFAVEWHHVQVALACNADQLTEEESQNCSSDDEDLVSEGLLMATEEIALVEEDYMGQESEEQFTEDEDWLEDIGEGYLPSSPLRSPAKRCRR